MQTKFTFIAILLFGMVIQSFAQTIVGTDPENKNVILEEFTGIYCGFCPEGHVIAQGIYDSHPEDVVLINIHNGFYATPTGSDPDFRTPWGAAIDGQAGVIGYPAGTVNRHLFPGWEQGSGTAMSRGQWEAGANQIMAEASYLNVAAIATINHATRELSVDVEVYYTGDSPEATNLLNVAILQNNILGPQQNGGMGDNYIHNHMLRHLMTGQWGVEISETTQGSLYSTTLTYTIPEDYNDVEVVLDDIEIAAFVTETHQEVVSGSKAIFAAENDNDIAVTEILFPNSDVCDGELIPQIEVRNFGNETLTSLDIEYTINNNESATYNWTGELHYTSSEIVVLPAIEFVGEPTNTLEISLTNPNGVPDENPVDNTAAIEFATAVETTGDVSMELFVGTAMASQISWALKNSMGEVIAAGDGYSNGDLIEMNLPVDATDCYDFFLYDSDGDGFQGYGFLKLYDGEELLVEVINNFGEVKNITFHADLGTSINQITNNNLCIYPNPAQESANIKYTLDNNSTVSIEVFSLLGTMIFETTPSIQSVGEQKFQLNTASLEEGIYLVNLKINTETITKKITVIK